MGPRDFLIFAISSQDREKVKTYTGMSSIESQNKGTRKITLLKNGEFIDDKIIRENEYDNNDTPWIRKRLAELGAAGVSYLCASEADSIIALDELYRDNEAQGNYQTLILPLYSKDEIGSSELGASKDTLLRHYEYLRELHEKGFPFPTDLEDQAKAIEDELDNQIVEFDQINWNE